MAQATYIQSGRFINYTPSSAVAEGQVVVINGVPCIAPRPIAADEQGVLDLGEECHVYKFNKETGTNENFAALASAIYWDASASQVTASADGGTNKKIGFHFSTAAIASTDTTAYIAVRRPF